MAKSLLFVFLLSCTTFQLSAQTRPDTAATRATDTTYAVTNPPPARPVWHKNDWVRAAVIPTLLVGYGLSVKGDRGLYSSEDMQRDVHGAFPTFFTRLDYGVMLLPYAELVALNLAKLPCRSDFINTTLIVLKGEALMWATVSTLKSTTKELRPNGEDRKSFPSGHTAQAFLAASIVHRETRHISRWYGAGAYAIATSVAGFRVLNNKHWQTDVLAGAGIGIMSSHIVYLTHKYRWGAPGVCFSPVYINGTPGLLLGMQF